VGVVVSDLQIWCPAQDPLRSPATSPAPVPADLLQYTFAELGEVRLAVFDASSGRHWLPMEGDPGLYHCRPGSKHFVRFTPKPQLASWGLPLNLLTMEFFLEQFGEDASDAVFALLVGVATALANPRTCPPDFGPV
jgi:hypothetical protein